MGSSNQRQAAVRTGVLAFGEYVFDLARHRLSCAGVEVRAEPQVLKLLAYLIQRGGELVSREELATRVWPEGATEETLNYSVSRARRALQQYPGPVLTTVRGRGYRFEPPLRPASEERTAPPLVERSTELQALRRLAASSANGKSVQFALVTGPAGIGKTSLVDAFAAEWSERAGQSHRARAMQGAPALWPWLCLLSELKQVGLPVAPSLCRTRRGRA